MNKKKLWILLGLIASLCVTPCYAEETETDETVASLAPITPSDYLIADVSDYVTLGEIENLSVTQYLYTITDEMVQYEVDYELSSSAEEIDADRPSQTGDTIYADVSYTIEGSDEDAETESTYFYLGDEEYGADFDQQLTGVSAGDELSFSISYDEDTWNEEWINQTVHFTVTVTSVCENQVPELTDEFVQENYEMDTVEDFYDSIREYLSEEYSDTSYSDAVTALFTTAAENAAFHGYPEDLFDSCKSETLDFYSMFTGTSEESEILEAFGMTQEDLDMEIQDTVNHRLLISAICEKAGLTVTEEEYISFVEEYASYYGYDNPAEFEEANGRTTMVNSLYEFKAGEYLYENADITEETYTDDLLEEDTDLE